MRKLALAAFSFSAAVFLAQYLIPMPLLPYLGAFFAAASLSGLFLKGEKRLLILLPLMSLALGMIWDFGYARLYFAPAERLDGTAGTITATVADFPTETEYGAKVTVRLREEGAPAIKTLLYLYDGASDLRPGDVLEVPARLSLADRIYNSSTDVFTSRGYFLIAKSAGTPVVTGYEGSGIRYFARYLAKAVNEKIGEIFPSEAVGLTRAFLTGDRDTIKEDTQLIKAFSVTGTYHVVAVSGMHVSFFAGFLIPLLGRKRGSVVTIPVIWIFAAVTGFVPSVVRSAFMQTLVLAAPILRREADSVTSLSAALAVILLLNPYSAAGTGLQFSFLATLGIILLSGRIFTWMENHAKHKKIYGRRYVRGPVRFAISCFSSTVGASVFTVPLTAVYFGYVSLVAPIVNILILWAVSLAFGIGITACLLGFVLLPLGRAAAFLAAVPAGYMKFVVKLFSKGQFASVYTTNVYVIWWLVYVYLIAVGAFIFRAKPGQLVVPACLGCTALCAVLILNTAAADGKSFEMTVLDVGQGQSVVYTSGSATALIDCGSSSGESAGDIAADYILGLGRRRIDLLILTHYHADHVNGLEQLYSRIDVTAIALPDPGLSGEDPLAEEIIMLASEHGSDIIYINVDITNKIGGSCIKLFAPMGKETENEQGLCILCTAGDFDALITGDIPDSTERQLVALEDLPDIELLIAGHHGSKTSTSQLLLDAAKPETAVISVGNNSYGHPSDEVLERLFDSGITVYRTDECGNITISGKKAAA